MKSKKRNVQIISMLIMTAITGSVAHAAGDNITLNFTGEIKAAACSVSSGGNQTVGLGEGVGTTVFGSTGDVSSAQPFAIVVTCPQGGPDQATVTFSGSAASDPTLLALDGGINVASGVAVRINEQDGSTQVKLNTPSATTALVSGENTLKFTAQYQALTSRGSIMPGLANATAQFTLNYP